jgi:hypothetical protein
MTAVNMVPPTRFERVAFRLGVRRSIQLSYGGVSSTLSIRSRPGGGAAFKRGWKLG